LNGDSNNYGASCCVHLLTKTARWVRDDDDDDDEFDEDIEIGPKVTFMYL